MANVAYRYYADATATLPYDSAEGGFQGVVFDTDELLCDHIGFSWSDELLRDVSDSLCRDLWCERLDSTQSEMLLLGWQTFDRLIKYKSRYVSLMGQRGELKGKRSDELSPSAMLELVEEQCREGGLLKELPAGTSVFRARQHVAVSPPADAASLGAPLPTQAKYANRMSAAGIAVFYGALEPKTALVETFDPKEEEKDAITVGKFETTRDLVVLDLSEIAPMPSFFDLDRADERQLLEFLYGFAREVAKPTVKDGREHIDYVPTQVFAEYVRFRMRTADDDPVDGIVYPSSRILDGKSIVLFCDKRSCGIVAENPWDRREQWVQLSEDDRECHAREDACKAREEAAEVLKENRHSLGWRFMEYKDEGNE